MKVAIIGYGLEGKAAYDYWNRDGNIITICDFNPNVELPEGVASQLGDSYLADLERFDLIVRSPNIYPKDITDASNDVLNIVTSNTNEFLRVCPTKNVIGITGTKGKGTTSTLIAKMLEADGKRVHLGGNIGIAPLDLLKNNIQHEDYVVLELSSFQLIDLKLSPHIAVCLMIVPEHLDWHSDTDEYMLAKSQIFAHQSADDFAIYSSLNSASERIASISKAWKVPYMAFPGAYVKDDNIVVDDTFVCKSTDIKLIGRHNLENVCAALTAFWKISQNTEAAKSVLTSFAGLEFRLQLIREFNGVRYYNDSFGTNPETAIVALEAFEQPKVIILGGSDKGASYDGLARKLSESNIRKAILIGEQGERIRQALESAGFTNYLRSQETTMSGIVNQARSEAQAGDVVLLSTACASYDMFKDYKDRGRQFSEAVQSLV